MSYSFETKNDKTVILHAFNNHFNEFLEDILRICPDNVGALAGQKFFTNAKRLNPTSLIKGWYKFVYLPYSAVIDLGNIDFFFEKDYQKDLAHLRNSNDVIGLIDNIRDPLLNMGEANKAHASTYLKNLCKLCIAYNAQ